MGRLPAGGEHGGVLAEPVLGGEHPCEARARVLSSRGADTSATAGLGPRGGNADRTRAGSGRRPYVCGDGGTQRWHVAVEGPGLWPSPERPGQGGLLCLSRSPSWVVSRPPTNPASSPVCSLLSVPCCLPGHGMSSTRIPCSGVPSSGSFLCGGRHGHLSRMWVQGSPRRQAVPGLRDPICGPLGGARPPTPPHAPCPPAWCPTGPGCPQCLCPSLHPPCVPRGEAAEGCLRLRVGPPWRPSRGYRPVG